MQNAFINLKGIFGPKPSRGRISVQPRSSEEHKRHAELQARAVQEKLFKKVASKSSQLKDSKPRFYQRPAFNTPQYWQDCARGWITDSEQNSDHASFEARRRRAIDSKKNKVRPPHRHERAAPRSTKQFSKQMSTQASRDDRLTPQSKALLHVLVARTGKGRSTDTTKTTLGAVMNRCPRSIQRYIQELIQFGYIRTQTIKSRRTGFFVGMRIWIMNSVLPFFAKKDSNYDPEGWLRLIGNRRIPEETIKSLTKNHSKIINSFREKKPPWIREFAF